MDWLKLIVIVLVAGVIGGVASGLVGGKSTAFGGTTNYDTVSASGLVIGSGCNQFGASCNGTTVSRINSGFCNVNASATTITASSSKTIDCGSGSNGLTALTGVTAGDKCFLTQGTTTSSVSNGLSLNGVSASTTSGFITAVVSNLTGATFTWTAAASTSWQYYCLN